MKTAIRIFMLVMLTASLSSCESISDLLDVEIDTTLEADLDILTDDTELKSTDAFGFNESDTLQVINPDLEDYEELIDAIEVESVTIEIKEVDQSGVILYTGTMFRISNTLGASYTWTLLDNWDLDENFSKPLPSDSYDDLNDILEAYDTSDVTVAAEGTCNKGSVHILLNYSLEIKVTSSPI
jgi:hypothetical protein